MLTLGQGCEQPVGQSPQQSRLADWRGPYSSEPSVTLMIARELRNPELSIGIQPIDKSIYEAHRIVRADIIVNRLRQGHAGGTGPEGESQVSLTEPDSRAMAAHTHVAVGYNVQIAVDAKHKLIVEQQVTNQVVDMGLLAQTTEPAKEVLGVERIVVVADRDYFKIEDIASDRVI
jgi:hypothetical protein